MFKVSENVVSAVKGGFMARWEAGVSMVECVSEAIFTYETLIEREVGDAEMIHLTMWLYSLPNEGKVKSDSEDFATPRV